MCLCSFFFFFFKQKTAYEMRISDWSSDVCSSDLLRRQGAEVSLINCPPAIETLLGTVAREHCELPPAPKAENPLLAVTIRIGRETLRRGREARDLISFLGLTVTVLLRSLLKPWRIRPVALITHMEQTGLNALPIVGLISFLVGVVQIGQAHV